MTGETASGRFLTNSKGQSLDDTYVVFDIETTGFSAIYDKIIEIGAVKVEKGNITERFSRFVNPERPIPYRIEELTKINDSMVIDADTIEKVLPEFLEFAKDCVLVAHNAEFDMSFIMHNATRLGYEYDFTYADTVTLARALIPTIGKYKLDNVAKIWEWTGNYVDNHTITVYLKRIREKLETDIIITIKGIGYRIDEK